MEHHAIDCPHCGHLIKVITKCSVGLHKGERTLDTCKQQSSKALNTEGQTIEDD